MSDVDQQQDDGNGVDLAEVVGQTAPPAPRPQLPATREPRMPIATGARLAPLVPRTLSDVIRLANVIHDSRLAPYGLKDASAISVAILTGMEIGLAPMASLRSIAVINGRPSIWGDAGMAMPRQSGLLVQHKEWFTGTPYNDDFTAHCLIQRKGEETVEGTFSVADAKMATLWAGMHIKPENRARTPWVAYPKRMLMWRARIVFRDAFPDVLLGMRFAEEVADDQNDTIEPMQRTALEPVGSGIAARLGGVTGQAGYASNGDVHEAMKEGGEDEGKTEQRGASAPVVDSAAAKSGADAPGGPGPATATAGGGATAGNDKPADVADVGEPTDDEKQLLIKMAEEFAGATTPAEVNAVWGAFREEIEHGSAGLQAKAKTKYEAKLAKAEKAKKAPKK